MSDLITTTELRIASQRTFADDDEYALWVIQTASEIVADRAKQPEWTLSSAPRAARRIAMRMAVSAIKNPDGEKSYTLGPLGGTYIDLAVLGLVLTEFDKEELDEFRPTAGGTGLFTITMTGGTGRVDRVYVPAESGGDDILYLDPQDAGAMTPPEVP